MEEIIHWFKQEERMPEIAETVLVEVDFDEDVQIGYFMNSGDWMLQDAMMLIDGKHIVAWAFPAKGTRRLAVAALEQPIGFHQAKAA